MPKVQSLFSFKSKTFIEHILVSTFDPYNKKISTLVWYS